MSDRIQTSPLALQAFNIIKWLDPLIGPIEAQSFMQASNDVLGGKTPVTVIKERRIDDVIRAVRCLAAEKGLFAEPWLPPENGSTWL